MSDKIKILVVESMKPCEVREIPDTLEMSDQEIRSLGFDLPQCMEPPQAHQGTKSAKRKGIYHER